MDPDSTQYWMERVRDAERALTTFKEANTAAIERVKVFKTNFGIKERTNGEIDIDYEKFVENLGEEAALSLMEVIEDRYLKQVANG